LSYVFDDILSRLGVRGQKPPGGAPARDIVVSLADALGPTWGVERETDFVGDVSVVVMPVIDNPAMPTFILYEAGGQARVGTVRGDEWEADYGFDTVRQAATIGIIAAIDRLATPTADRGQWR
jgi:hypothetical protein